MRGLLDLADVSQLHGLDRPDLKYEPWVPYTQRRLAQHEGRRALRRRSRSATSSSSTRTTRSRRASKRSCARLHATRTSSTLKTTVYRTSQDSALAPALIKASENGKQAVCVVELKARFDEQRNIEWARALEQAGVHVVYGFPDMKIHAKTTLVVRREGDELRRYVHIGTGNYHATTARTYEDIGVFTADPEIAADIADLFNFVTGFGRPQRFRKLLVAPFNLRKRLVEQIRDVADGAPRRASPRVSGSSATASPTSTVIEELYEASQAGVEIDLIVRAICTLRPGCAGAERDDPRALGPRALPRAQPHLLLRGGRREDVPARQRRPDAAQPRPPDRGRRCRSRTRTCGTSSSRSSRRSWPTTRRRGSSRPTVRGIASHPKKAERRRPAQVAFMRRRERARRLARSH